jgi:anti-anti-sigma factor
VFRTLAQKVTISAVVFLALIVVNAVNALVSINASDRDISHLAEHTLKQADASVQFNFHLARAIADAEAFARDGERKGRDEAFEQLNNARAELGTLATLVGSDDRSHDSEAAIELSALQARRADLLAQTQQRVDELVRIVETGDTRAIDQVLTGLNAIEGEFEELEATAAELINREVQQATDELAQRTRIGRIIVPGSFGVMALLVLLAVWLIGRFIVRPIRQLSQAAACVAAGNLEQSIRITNTDEIGDLQQSFNNMVVSLLDQHDAIQSRNAELEQSLLQQQQLFATIQQLSTPLLPIDDRVVVLPVVGHIDTRRADEIMQTLLHGVAARRARIAIVDITGVPVIDTAVANALLRAATAIRLLGAEAVLTGVRPEVAQTLVQLGIDLDGIVTQSSLQSGIAFALGRE